MVCECKLFVFLIRNDYNYAEVKAKHLRFGIIRAFHVPFPCNPVGQRIVCPRQWSHFINIDIAQSIIHHSNLVRHLNLSEIGVLHLDKIRTQSFRYAVKLPLYSNIICAVQFMSSSVYNEFAIVVAFYCPLSNVILSILEPPFCISHQITLNRFKCMDSCAIRHASVYISYEYMRRFVCIRRCQFARRTTLVIPV